MMKTAERRVALLSILCERKKETLDNLAFELQVSKATIKRDIVVLSLSYPIYTTPGIGGGIQVVEGFRLGMKYLTENQCELLEHLSQTLEGKDKEVLHSIIKTFKKPDIKGKK